MFFVCFLWFYELPNESKHSQDLQLFMEKFERNREKKGDQAVGRNRWLKRHSTSLTRRHERPPPLRQDLLWTKRETQAETGLQPLTAHL